MSRGSIDIPVISKFDPTGIKQAQGALKGFGKSLLGIGTLVAGAFAGSRDRELWYGVGACCGAG